MISIKEIEKAALKASLNPWVNTPENGLYLELLTPPDVLLLCAMIREMLEAMRREVITQETLGLKPTTYLLAMITRAEEML